MLFLHNGIVKKIAVEKTHPCCKCDEISCVGRSGATGNTRKGYTFIALDLVKNDAADISVVFPPENLPAEDTALNVEKLLATENAITYDITLTINGEIAQPPAPVTVKIPVPDTMKDASCKVYRQEADGTYTNMQAIYQDGYVVFTTEHFSIYVLTTESLGVTLGDINGDGTVDDWDSVLLDRYLAGWEAEINTSAADMDENGIVDDWDGILLARKLAGWN